MSNPLIPTSTSNRIRPEYRFGVVLLAALGIGLLTFYACKFFATREVREMTQSPSGGLEWLRREFHLSDTQFKNIADLQAAYAPACNEMCSRIMEANSKVSVLVAQNHAMTPELEASIQEANAVESNCRTQTLAHIYRVSAQMNPSDGQRYLRMMASRVLQPGLSSDTAIKGGTN
jgi:hypothetical protein